jgi:thiamine kinase-like enzyme
VFSHGDPGPHNLLVGETGTVTFVDWENADPEGMPLWDLFAFLRGFTTWASRRRRPGTRVAAIRRTFVEGSPFTRVVAESIERYRDALSLDRSFVEPLFWTCWMTLAVREAPRLTAARLAQGFQLRALEALAGHASSPILRRILQVEPSR